MATNAQGQKGAVLITGAAGGIGTTTARQLVSLGFRVFAGVRKPADGKALQASVSSRIVPVVFDITDAASLAAAAELVAREVGTAGLSGLVNNAGLIVEGPVELVPLDEVRRQFEVNVIGQVAVTQAFLPLLRQAHGRIVNIGAVTGKTSIPYLGVLSSSKAALESITDALRMELRPWGITVSIVEPTAMQTTIFNKSSAAARVALQQVPAERQKLYAPALAAVSQSLEKQHVDAPDVVTAAIIHALTARRPRTRYAVGRGAGMVVALRLLPDSVRDGLLLGQFGLSNVQPGQA
ncbi:MAG TPA: SDR family NAD(P)-dependent oxidoreductase [Ktedonobacteraceae bacterium]|nr:SDR family NAD(P)-dependent oxidoreductase [Ktedonobacteraceae bacterium]